LGIIELLLKWLGGMNSFSLLFLFVYLEKVVFLPLIRIFVESEFEKFRTKI